MIFEPGRRITPVCHRDHYGITRDKQVVHAVIISAVNFCGDASRRRAGALIRPPGTARIPSAMNSPSGIEFFRPTADFPRIRSADKPGESARWNAASSRGEISCRRTACLRVSSNVLEAQNSRALIKCPFSMIFNIPVHQRMWRGGGRRKL